MAKPRDAAMKLFFLLDECRKKHGAHCVTLNHIEEAFRKEKEIIQGLLEALGALSHPDGVIRGPLYDGPELDELNEAISKAQEGR